MNKIIKDRLSFTDNHPEHIKMPKMQSHGLWARTEILASNDEVVLDKDGVFSHFAKKVPTGKSALGETIFKMEKVAPKFVASNMVPIGGCQYAMEMIYGVTSDKLDIPTLYDGLGTGIGLKDVIPSTCYDIPGGQKVVIHDPGNFVQLFGVGVTGTAENDITVHPVSYRENSIDLEYGELTGTMIPFRYTTESLSTEDKLKYFGKKTSDGGQTAYYLKKFDQDPVIRHISRTGEDIEDEKELSENEIWLSSNNTNAIESFTECRLVITKKDIKEWFLSLGQEDKTRINTIALFSGRYVKDSDDYCNVRMFSKLNIPTEYLSLTKDLNLVYRVYTA